MQGSSRGSDSMVSSKVGSPHAAPSPRERAPAVGREPGAGVEAFQLRHRPEGDRSAAVGRPVERLIVDHDERAIARHAQIELDGIDAERHGLAQRLEGVLRCVGAIAAMADDRPGARIEQDHGCGHVHKVEEGAGPSTRSGGGRASARDLLYGHEQSLAVLDRRAVGPAHQHAVHLAGARNPSALGGSRPETTTPSRRPRLVVQGRPRRKHAPAGTRAAVTSRALSYAFASQACFSDG